MIPALWPGSLFYIVMKKIIAALSMGLILAACGGTKVKVIVYANGTPTADGSTVNLKSGSGHSVLEMFPPDKTITVKTGEGDPKTFNLDGDGLYILNLKKDTLIGSYQAVGTEVKQEVISQESLQHRIDSLKQLMAGANVSEKNRNYCIAPNQIAKISPNMEAQVVGPFLKMPASFAGDVEVYKFYTNKEAQENIDRLQKMVTPAEEEKNN